MSLSWSNNKFVCHLLRCRTGARSVQAMNAAMNFLNAYWERRQAVNSGKDALVEEAANLTDLVAARTLPRKICILYFSGLKEN